MLTADSIDPNIPTYTFQRSVQAQTRLPETENRNKDLSISKSGSTLSISVPAVDFSFLTSTLSFQQVSLKKKDNGDFSLESETVSAEAGLNGATYLTMTAVRIDTEKSKISLDEDGNVELILSIDWGITDDTATRTLTGILGCESFDDAAYMQHSIYAYYRNSYAPAGIYQFKAENDNDPQVKAGIIELALLAGKSARALSSTRMAPCEPVDPASIVLPPGAQAVASTSGLPFFTDRICLHSRGEKGGPYGSSTTNKTIKNEDPAVDPNSSLYENTVSWEVDESAPDRVVFTSQPFQFGSMPFKGTMKVTVDKANVKNVPGSQAYYFDGFVHGKDYSYYTVTALGMTQKGKVEAFRAVCDPTAADPDDRWKIYIYVDDWVKMLYIIPVHMKMQIHSRGVHLQ